MQRQVIFNDYQEQTAADHNNLQDYARETFDDLARDAVSPGRLYAGFDVSKSGQVEVTVAPGRMFDQGIVAKKREATPQSLSTYLAAAASRIVTVSVFSQEEETDIETRDYMIDVDTGETEPRSVATTRSRAAVLSFTAGSEAADPQPPALPSTHVAIANILVDATQVVSVTMLPAGRIKSLADHEARLAAQESFKTQIEPRVTSLASDLSRLSSVVDKASTKEDLITLYQDVADIRRRLDVPALSTDVFVDDFSTPDYSDTENAAALGYDAMVDNGVRFGLANEAVKSLNIFSANDPNATVSNGILLPKFTNERKLHTGAYHSDIGIAQYGFQTTNLVQKTISKQRLAYGPVYAWYYPFYYNRRGFLRNFVYAPYYYYETYTETYWEEEVVNHSINGALVGQTFLVANDMWATQLGFYVSSKAANEDIWVTLCEVTNGMPDKDKAVLVQSFPHANISIGWNRLTIPPTFLESGKRYAMVLMSNANHRLGMASGESYVDGTFFYSTDGEYFLGDLTKDLMIEVWGAKFNSSQVAIELEALNLDGGIGSIDLTASAIAPASAQLVYEVQPSGTGKWYPLNDTDTSALNGNPPLCRFRARFVGTRDMHAGVKLTGSEVRLFRPKTTFKHVSSALALSAPSDEHRVKLIVDGYDPAHHTLTCGLRVGATTETPDVTETVLKDAVKKRYEITFKFDLAAANDAPRIILEGSTDAGTNMFHVSERIFWAQ